MGFSECSTGYSIYNFKKEGEIMRFYRGISLFVFALAFCFCGINYGSEQKIFRAGGSTVDSTPQAFPRKCNGGFAPSFMSKVEDPLSVRALVLDDGSVKIGFAVIDACGMNADLRDEIAREVQQKTGIPADYILIASTHCHSAPALTLILGCGPDQEYVDFVKPKIVDALVQANANLQPAEIGWSFDQDPNNVYCRRFLMKEGKAYSLPSAFTGSKKDIAQMNPGMNNPNAIRRTGIADPTVSIIALRSKEGKPLAILGNYSTHYAGVKGGVISSDYFGVFCTQIAKMLGASDHFTAVMTNGTSGDSNCVDFLNPNRKFTKETVGLEVAQAAKRAWDKVEFHSWVPLSMKEETLTLSIRKPSASDRDEAVKYVKEKKITAPRNALDLYALDTIALFDAPPEKTIRLQGIRIGDLGIGAIPCEVYSFTGREIRAKSPAKQTFNISMANGYNGYIPTTDSFELGGYNTWRAQSCCLETTAEPKIRAEILRLLNDLWK